MLDWSMIDLANAARVSVSTVKRVEEVQLQPVSDSTRAAIQGAFEEAGIVFLEHDGVGHGLRLRSDDAAIAASYRQGRKARL